MDNNQFVAAILNWFKTHGRKDLPWQHDINPYRIWLSEIMLQQTQVSTVIPYFQHFMQNFPFIHLLANAKIDEILHLWTGLGYYARARNLHKTAKIITQDFSGQFPADLSSLQSLPGIGKSTAGAILAIAFNQRAAILDGNVKRVLTRFHAIEGSISSAPILRRLWDIAEDYTPSENSAQYTQAMMDLGATVCTRTKPLCHKCPLKSHCNAHAQNREIDFPQNKARAKIPVRKVFFVIVKNKNAEILLIKRPYQGIWGGLWSFLECDQHQDVVQWFFHQNQFKLTALELGESFRHTFTHFHLDITPIFTKMINCDRMMDSDSYLWYNLQNPQSIGLAAPVKRILDRLKLAQ